jgi:hypothetical protein
MQTSGRRARLGPPQIAYLLVAVSTGFIGGSALRASAHSECWQDPFQFSPNVFYGDDHQNACTFTDGYDSAYGYGEDDDLWGLQGRDELRGAGGGDEIYDKVGGDTDIACDGSGSDTIDFLDDDGNDHVHEYNGSGADQLKLNTGDTDDLHSECPV